MVILADFRKVKAVTDEYKQVYNLIKRSTYLKCISKTPITKNHKL